MSNPIPPRPEVWRTAPAHHGAPDHAELRRLGLSVEEVLDFSVNSNPYGPSPRVWDALARVPLDRYPDRDALTLREALASHHRVPPERIVVGNGTAELIWLVALAFVRPGDRCLVLEPTFGEYARAVRLMGGWVLAWRAREDTGFAFVAEEIAARLAEVAPRLVWLCNPNNPTGQVLPDRVLASWADAHPHTLFVVDEAYINFVPGLESAIALNRPNVLVLRSMTKDYALAGLRLGYAVASEEVVAALARVRPPWNVNALAQAAGVVALADQAHLQRTLAALCRAGEAFRRGLVARGLEPFPSATHFFLLHVGDAAAFRSRLLAHGIQVRDATSFGLPGYVRVATRRPEENARFLQALDRGAARIAPSP